MSPLHVHRRSLAATVSGRSLRLLAGLVLLAGCGEPVATHAAPPGAAAVQSRTAAAARQTARAAEQRDLAALRAATARFHRFAEAGEAAYTFLFMNTCMADQSGAARGGMGFHYVNTGLLDASVDVAAPEALLYEPGPNGQRRLVGVEYVIPKAAWRGAEPPVLFGREFTLNAFDLWALHVWVWKDNPSGLYADWNPRVSCEHAGAASAGAHH